jgi:hypothetical protein
MTVRGNNIHCSNECMETELQGCYILHVCAKELLAESERAISATVPHGHGLRHISCREFDVCIVRYAMSAKFVGVAMRKAAMCDHCAMTLAMNVEKAKDASLSRRV